MTQEELIEKVVRAICLHRTAPACSCREVGVCRALTENLMSVHSATPQQARAAISIALEEAAKVVERVGPVVVRPDMGHGSSILDVGRSNEMAAAIRALIPSEERPQPSTLPAP